MPLFIYRCPTTGQQVQGFSADDLSEDMHTYKSVLCMKCKRFHMVNPATGAVLARDAEQATPREGPSRQST